MSVLLTKGRSRPRVFVRVDGRQQKKGPGIVGSARCGLPGIEHGLVELLIPERERRQRQQDRGGALVKTVRGLVFLECLVQRPVLFKQTCRHKMPVGIGLRVRLGAHAACQRTGHAGWR